MREAVPNILTLTRGILTLLIIPLFFVHFSYRFEVIYGLFFVATISDFLDGYLARKWKVVSDFGKMFDPLLDKILTLSLFMLLIPFNLLPTWVFVLFLIRELFVDGMKNFCLYQGQVIPAILSAKWKTFFQMVMLHATLLLLIFPGNTFLTPLVFVTAYVGLILAYTSGYTYFTLFLKAFRL